MDKTDYLLDDLLSDFADVIEGLIKINIFHWNYFFTIVDCIRCICMGGQTFVMRQVKSNFIPEFVRDKC